MSEENKNYCLVPASDDQRSTSKCEEGTLTEMVNDALADIHTEIEKGNAITVPIVQLGLLGGSIASMIPAFRTITQTTTSNTAGLFRWVNANSSEDALKVAQNGDLWGAFRTGGGNSKLARFQEVGQVSSTNTVTMPIDPMTMMMAAALFAIEQQLGIIEEMGQQIISFLEIEKEAKIEADVKTLTNMITNYKHNWDNKLFVASNHKMVLDIQRSAREHMISYHRIVSDSLKTKSLIVGQSKVAAALEGLLKKFKYYKLSLFTYSLASMLEVMLSGNYKEDYIQGICQELEAQGEKYRDLFTKSSVFLEKSLERLLRRVYLKGSAVPASPLEKLWENYLC